MSIFKTKDGAELYYKVEGNEQGNPPLIFIHGWCSNLNHWESQVTYFQAAHRILRMDRRGMGKSTSPGSGHTPEQHAGGAPAGVYFSYKYPDLVRAYVMVDSALRPEADLDNPTEHGDKFFSEMIEKLMAADGETYFRNLYTSFFGPQADRAMVRTAVAEACTTPVDVRVKEIRLMAADTLTPAAAMQQPSLVIAGPWMGETFPQAVDHEHLKSCFENVELARAIGTGHFVQLEVPDQANAFIKNFVSRLE